jgi:hypothetical protein
MAVNGTFIINVVGYDRYKTCAPSFLTIVLSASNALLNFLVAAGPVVLLLLLEILFILILLLLLPPPIPSPLIAFTSLGQFPPNCICILCFTVSNGVCTASPTIVANAPALASATNSPYADDDDDDDPIGFKRNIFFPYSYVAKYTACAGPAPNPPATTPRYRPFTPSVFKIDRIAFGIVLLIIFIELLVLLLLLVKEEDKEAEEEDDAAATSCIRVFTVSTGNITVCSIVPANAPANMCCVYSIDDFCRDDDESVVVFMVVFVVVVVVFMVSRKSSPERKRLLVYEMMCRKRIK